MSSEKPSHAGPLQNPTSSDRAVARPSPLGATRLIALIGSPLVLLVLGYLVFTEIRAEQEARRAAQTRQAILLEFHAIRTHLNTAETAIRRLAATGDPANLAVKDSASVRLAESMVRLRELLPTPEGQARVTALEPFLDAILAESDRMVEAIATGTLPALMTDEAVRRRQELVALAQGAFQAFEADFALAAEPPSHESWLIAVLAVAALLSISVSVLQVRSNRRLDQTAKELADKNVALTKQEAYFRTVVDTIPDVLFAQDAEGRFRMANRATAEVLGIPLDRILGQKHADVSPHEEDIERLAEQVREVLESGASNSVVRKVLHPLTEQETWFETRVVPLFPSSGTDMQALVVATDHTEKFRAQQIIRASQHEMLSRLAEAAEFRDGETGLHTRRVALLAAEIARMVGMSEHDVELIEQAAPLHDVGKIGIPDAILLKPGSLSQTEFEIMKTHTLIGAKLLAGGASELMAAAERICLMHHERWDGSGYPAGLREEETPLMVQVVWVADVVDALGHARPYRDAWPLDRIIADLKNQRAKKFSTACTDACLELLTAPGGRERWIEDPTSTRIRSIKSVRRRGSGDRGQARLA